MTKINIFTKACFTDLRKDIDTALDEVGRKYGIKLGIKNIRFTDTSFKTQLEANIISPKTGNVITEGAKNLELSGRLVLGRRLNIAPKDVDLTRTYHLNGDVGDVRFTEYHPHKPRWAFNVLQVSTGKTYRITEDTAVNIVRKNCALGDVA